MNTFLSILSSLHLFLALSFSALTALSILEDYREGTPDEKTRMVSRFMVILSCLTWSLFYLNFLFLP